MQILYGTDFQNEYCPKLNNSHKCRSLANKTLKEGDLIWLIEDSEKLEYYNLGCVTEIIGGPEGLIQSPIVRTTTESTRDQ